ncbi:PAS domain-containing protein [Methyloversatilis sp. XJ19-13]|uniref:PAS domain-containing protein n=1 Tax=Methyloversatilis sp. XJ19-13 TaxID=2963430 RepID=UPI00211B96EC|nr:PAS domain-containing protein [Methyloversatilis sp. XJ19-13]
MDVLARRRFWNEVSRFADCLLKDREYEAPTRGTSAERHLLIALREGLLRLRTRVTFFEEEHAVGQILLRDALNQLDELIGIVESINTRATLLEKVVGAAIWSMIPGQCAVLDPSHPVQWSDALRRMLGFSGREDFPDVLGSWIDLIHPNDRSSALETLTVQCNGEWEGVWPDTFIRLAAKDGVYRSYRSRVALSRNAYGRPTLLLGAIEDVEQQRLESLQVEDALARFDAANVIVTQGSWDMRVHQGDPLSVLNWVEWSPQFRKLLGYQTEVEFPASVESWVSRLHPEDKARALSSIRDLQSGEITSNVEYRLRCADEHFRLFRATHVAKRSTAGVLLRVVGALTAMDRGLSLDQCVLFARESGVLNRKTAWAEAHRKEGRPVLGEG